MPSEKWERGSWILDIFFRWAGSLEEREEGIKEVGQVVARATQAAHGEVFRGPDELNHLTGIP